MRSSELLDELRRQRSTLDHANALNATARLTSILEWLCKEGATKEMIERLEAEIDASKVFPQARSSRVVAATREEIAFVGYALMTNCRKSGFWELCVGLNIRGAYSSSNVNEITRTGLDEYVLPFLDYIEDELASSVSCSTLTSMIDVRLGTVVEQCLVLGLPEVAQLIGDVAAEFAESEAGVRWQNVGNSCRETLRITVRELISRADLPIDADVQAANVKRLARVLVEQSAVSDSRGTLTRLIEAVWDHAQSVTHREATTKEEAARLFIWSCLAISELVALLPAAK
jgi:hypothetical protein